MRGQPAVIMPARLCLSDAKMQVMRFNLSNLDDISKVKGTGCWVCKEQGVAHV